MLPAPILLFVYNRPTHTLKTLNALRQNKLSDQSELFIFSDGYKSEADKAEVEKVRTLIRSVEGFKAVHIIENPHNLGLAKNIIGGVTQIVNEYGKVIVLEDDLVTAPYFLTFMNEGLEQFEHEEKIGHIHGHCFPLTDLPDAFLIKWTGSWGWATWQRAWSRFNADGRALLDEIERRKLSKKFDFNGNYPFTRMLRRQVNGENDSWAIRWNASLFLADMLSLNAGKSLIQNTGFDGSGIHSGSEDIYTTELYTGRLSIDIGQIEENIEARKAFERYYGRTNSFAAKAIRRLRRIRKQIKI